jgi:hypothetical protein
MTKVLSIALTPLLMFALAVNAWATNVEANETWLAGYESGDQLLHLQAVAVVAGIAITAKSFVSPAQCPKPKDISMHQLAAETAKAIKGNKDVSMVIVTAHAFGRLTGCSDPVSRWVRRSWEGQFE